ncbi:lipoprotein [Aliidiomarina sp.]
MFALFCAALLAGCGQKGPLEMPEPAEQTQPSESTQVLRLLVG